MKTLLQATATTFALVWSAATAPAQQAFVPQLHDVTGVAANDTLNIRGAPDASAPILGELAPNASGIEVTALNAAGTWGRIGAGEADGWVSMAYLAQRPFPPGAIPGGMNCLGTEPFWSLSFQPGVAHYRSPDRDLPGLSVAAAATSVPPGNQLFGFDVAGPGDTLSGVVRAEECSDGMSDRSFGWSVVLVRRHGGAMTLQNGCCTLDQR